MSRTKLLITTLLSLILTCSLIPASYATNTENLVNDGWKFTISPYIWGLSMNGTVGVGSRHMHLDQSFSDILQKLNFAGMLWADARHDKFGAFLNGLYASMSDDGSQGILSVHDRNQFALLSGGISYQVYENCFGSDLTHPSHFFVEPYVGFRYTANTVSLKFSIPAFSITANNDQYWTDPIVGARFITQLSNGINLTLLGDVGGVNASSQYSYNAIGLLGYQPQTYLKNSIWYLGYRVLDQVYRTGKGLKYFNWNMKLTGPLVGVAFNF